VMPADTLIAMVKYLFLAHGGTIEEWREEG
jgi:hypothetical protein